MPKTDRKILESELTCSICGHMIPIYRLDSRLRSDGHNKHLYCYICKDTTIHIENKHGEFKHAKSSSEFWTGKIMDDELFKLHIEAGLVRGKEKTCFERKNYLYEKIAMKVAMDFNKKGSVVLAPYPCAFCGGWHLGKERSIDELNEYLMK